MTTLVEQAKEIEPKQKKGKEYSDEEIRVAIAWAKREISVTQGKAVIGITSSSNFYSFVGIALRDAFERGFIKEV